MKPFCKAIILQLLWGLFLFSAKAQTGQLPRQSEAKGSYQAFRGDTYLNAHQLKRGNIPTTPVVKWSYTVAGGDGEPGIGDVNGDGINEVFNADGSRLTVFNGINGSVLWEYTGSAGYGTPVLANINASGGLELIAWQDSVKVFDAATGAPLWAKDVPGSGLGSANVADIISGGSPEIVVISDTGVYCLSGATGAIIKTYHNFSGAFTLGFQTPAIGDVNNDGQLDIVFFAEDSGELVAMDGATGNWIWSFISSNSFLLNSAVISDINNDCKNEVLWCPDTLYCFNGTTGQVLWQSVDAGFFSMPAVADLDGDCFKEVIISGPKVYTSSGAVVWTSTVGGSGWHAGNPRIADLIPSSPGLEIIFGHAYDLTGVDIINLFSSTGTNIWNFSLPGVSVEGISIGDIDNDGCAEIVAGADALSRSLIVIDDVGGASACGFTPTLDTAALSAFSASDTVLCSGDTVDFNFTGFNCGTTWNWTFSGANIGSSNVQSPQDIIFNGSSNTFPVTLIAQSACLKDTAYLVLSKKASCATPPVDPIIPDSMFIPNVFTPNGDGKNDFFSVYTTGYSSVKCDVYNRWGNLIYTMTQPNEVWSKANQQEVPDGTYYYIVHAEKISSKEKIEKKGFLELIR